MKYMTSDEIRDTWLKFFESKGHYIEPSSNLIPKNDKTLLWINAGVAALKKYFDGTEQPTHRRITNAQKAIRTNDIDNVGRTSRHHTFFEMLGNFSIGDYFRDEVLPWAYELLTDEKYFGFSKDRLYVSYYPTDHQTRDLWIKCGIDPTHMIPLESNFWEVGQGPCGPDTEIYYDRGEEYDPLHRGVEMLLNDEDNDRYIEIWNIVFSTYNSEPSKKRSEYKELPQKNIDTGAGLERFACVIQGARTNFETDLFMPYIEYLQKHSSKKYEGEYKYSFQVIADHIRSITFALSDGASFSNEGRGYVLRRLVRRMTRQSQILEINENDLVDLVDVVAMNMKHFYPYLMDKKDKVKKVLLDEVKKFISTLSIGIKRIEQVLKNAKTKVLSGQDAFVLSDTYGIPLDLTKEIANSYGYEVDEEGFNQALKEQKVRAREARGERNSFAKQSKDLLEFTKKSEFTYEENKEMKATIIGLFKDGERVDSITDSGEIILDKTDFYAESGGQVADVGLIEGEGFTAKVIDVTKANHKQFLHHVELIKGKEINGQVEVTLKPDFVRRSRIKKNHSAAHLLQSVLKQVLSEDIHQEGSYVDEEEMRFDFNYEDKIDDNTLNIIEEKVNEIILSDVKCTKRVMKKDEALKTGAIALFDEKYGDEVRIVEFENVSKEFCGGTHVDSSIELMQFALISCSSIAAGIKRITAYTGMKAYRYRKEQEATLDKIAELLQVKSHKELENKIVANNNNYDCLTKKYGVLSDKYIAVLYKLLKNDYVKQAGVKIIAHMFDSLTHDQVLSLVKQLIVEDNTAVLLVSKNLTKVELAVGISKDLQNKYSAGKLIKNLASLVNGSGGGRSDIAFGGAQAINDFNVLKNALIEEMK